MTRQTTQWVPLWLMLILIGVLVNVALFGKGAGEEKQVVYPVQEGISTLPEPPKQPEPLYIIDNMLSDIADMQKRLNGIDEVLLGYQAGWTVHVEGEFIEVWPPHATGPSIEGETTTSGDAVMWFEGGSILYDERTAGLAAPEGDAE